MKVGSFALWRATPENPRPDVSFVPPLERRRLTVLERAALAVAHAVDPSGTLPVVFASRWGEVGDTLKLMRQFREEGEMSPAGFSASVHNAAPGAWSVLTRNHRPYTAVAARRATLAAGFLEACASGGPVLYVYAEEATPEFYRPAFGAAQEACACAVVVDGTRGDDPPLPTDTFAEFAAALEARGA